MPDLRCCWECRYSSCEMLYMELRGKNVITYLHHSPQNADRFSFDEVLAGEQDAMISQLFGRDAVDEVKSAIQSARNPAAAKPTKEQLRERRRREDRQAQKRGAK